MSNGKNEGFIFPKNVLDSFKQAEKISNIAQAYKHIIPNQEIEELNNSLIENKKREEQYKQRVLSALEGIQRNTANLTEIISLLHDSNEKQEEIFEIMVEILSIGIAQNEQEAESKYRKIANKISQFSGDIETVQKLYGFASNILTIIKGIHGHQ